MTRHAYFRFIHRISVVLVAAGLAVTNPALAADKTLTVSGDSVPSDCAAAKSPNGGASKMTGSLEGCLAVFIQHENCRAMNGFDYYVQLGREEFEGKLEGSAIKFETLYTFNAIWPSGSCPSPAPEKELSGGCTHFVPGDGIQGVIRFYDVIPTVGKGATNFPYEGTLTISGSPSAAIAPVLLEPEQVAMANVAVTPLAGPLVC